MKRIKRLEITLDGKTFKLSGKNVCDIDALGMLCYALIMTIRNEVLKGLSKKAGNK